MAEKDVDKLPPIPFDYVSVPADRCDKTFRDIDQASLLVLAPLIGRACLTENSIYLSCRSKDESPATCVEEGIDVQRCVNKVYDDFEKEHEFVKYRNCLIKKTYFFAHCKKEKENFFKMVATTKYE